MPQLCELHKACLYNALNTGIIVTNAVLLTLFSNVHVRVGLADPNALNQAVAAFQACHQIGKPECEVNI